MAFQPSQVEDFLGRGLTLPIQVVNGRWPIESGPDLIKASIQAILRWAYGTRFMLAEFGSMIDQLIEEPNDDVLAAVAHTFIVEALSNWEKRIEVLDSSIERPDAFTVNVSISYRIIATQRTDSLVFPFYSQITT